MTVVGVITQARTTSTRLPGKLLRQVDGRRILDHHLDRLVASGFPVLVATTTNTTDDEIVGMARARGIGTYRGSDADVLSRFHGCAAEFGLDVVVRVTSDCPLVDPDVIRAGVDEYLAADDERLYLSNCLKRTFPRGLDFEVFSAAALAEADAEATELPEREHVTPYLYHHPRGSIRQRDVVWTRDVSHLRLTLDTLDDLHLIEVMIERHGAASLRCAELVDVLEAHPELVAINDHVPQKPLRPLDLP